MSQKATGDPWLLLFFMKSGSNSLVKRLCRWFPLFYKRYAVKITPLRQLHIVRIRQLSMSLRSERTEEGCAELLDGLTGRMI